jgi:hypothetical protein
MSETALPEAGEPLGKLTASLRPSKLHRFFASLGLTVIRDGTEVALNS